MRAAKCIPLWLGAAAFAVAFLQRPGEATSDTKIDLHVAPVHFLGEVASVWSSSGGLGQIQGGQYSGYLWPMGPFFALGDVVGLPDWVVHRLWLGVLLALAAWGVVKLLEELVDEPHAPTAQAAAGLVFIVNPYVMTFTQATTVTLLGYAALPWLLVAVHRGLRRPGGWWWPALFALVLTSTGGGVNAAVTAWLLLGPVLFLLYEWWTGAARRRAVWGLAWRTALLSVVASGWWVIPVAVHAAFGINFLPFTESAGAIWATTSIPESLRLMGYWLSYLGAGYGSHPLPYFEASDELLFSAPVVVASLLVPALAVAGLVWSRRWRYAPFFLLLLLVGLLVMSAGFPDGTPFRRALTQTYDHVESIQFLRTTYKAGPLVALAVACLAGVGASEVQRRVGGRGARVAAALAGAALVALGSWPLASGHALDPKFTFEEVPVAWRDASEYVDGRLGPNARALILPGQLYAFYRWGATVDPILPALAERPVASRTAVPYADLHAVDALWTVDSGIQQERFVPGQLDPLLRWLAVGQVVTGTDDMIERSGATAPLEAHRALAIAGIGRPAARFPPYRAFSPDSGSATPERRLPQVRVYESPGAAFVRLEPRDRELLVDGSADGVAALAAFGGFDPLRAFGYAGDSDDDELHTMVEGARELVVTDSNRRRVLSPARPRQTWGRTLEADTDIPADAPRLDVFDDRGHSAETIAVLRGVRYLRSPFASGRSQFPEHRPFAAFDGDPATWWEPDRELRSRKHWIEIGFGAPRDVTRLEILPRRQSMTTVTAVEIGDRRYSIRPGWNRLETGLDNVRSLRIRIAARDLPPDRHGGPGAIAEIRVPGLHVSEVLRPPRLLEEAAREVDLSNKALTYLFTRTTGDRPFRRQPVSDPDAAAVPREESEEPVLIRDAGDAEREIARAIAPPQARAYEVDAWVSVATNASDEALDRVAGYSGPNAFRSSSRYEGRPGLRASSAFDADPDTAWIGRSVPGDRAWIEWSTPSKTTVTRLRLTAPAAPGRLPTRVTVRADGTAVRSLPVGADGLVRMPRPLTARTFRIEAAAAVSDAVGIGDISGAGVPVVRIRRSGPVRGRCGDLIVRGAAGPVPLRVHGRVERLDDAFPLRASGCGRLALPAGRQVVRARGRTFLPYLVQLRSPADAVSVEKAVGSVADPGNGDGSERDGVTLDLAGPARLVLAESFNEGWRASCDGRDLGRPELAAGYANGWEVPVDCRAVKFRFAPQRAVTLGYVLSGVACLSLLALLLVGRRRRRPIARVRPRRPSESSVRALPLASAVGLGLLLAVPVAFVFALRAGAVAFPLLTLLFWRGASLRALLLGAAGLLVVVVPLLYVLFPPGDLGGYNSTYPVEILAAHWVSVAVFMLLSIALTRMLARR